MIRVIDRRRRTSALRGAVARRPLARRLRLLSAALLVGGCAEPASTRAPVSPSAGAGSAVPSAAPSPSPAAPTPTTDVVGPDGVHARAVYTLYQAVAEALSTHPRIRAARAGKVAAEARLDEARLAELPAAGVSAQVNRSTGNTTPGLFFPAQGFPAIAGPVEGKALDAGTWQTGGGLWASWDALAFARDAGTIDAALAQRHASNAQIAVQQVDVAYGAADAFLLLLEAQETVRAAQAAVDRADTLVKMTKPLVDQSLRPGVDLARAQAELAAARTLLANATQGREVRRAGLAVAIGHVGSSVEATPGDLLVLPDGARPGARIGDNPRVVQADAVVDRYGGVRAAVRAQFLPRVDLVAALFARGTGLSVPGLPQSPAGGLVPDVANWAVGLVVTWSALDVAAISARSRAASADLASAIARRDEVVLAVGGELEAASAFLEGARSVARETPIALSAAQAAEQQAVARYRASLAPIVDLADAERVLAQAEINDAIARIEVERARLALARAAGDLEPFLSR